MKTSRTYSRGFTLTEIMIVVAILGILASIVYPSYLDYVLRGNRSEGKALLLDAAARQERYYAQNNTYASSVGQLGYTSADSQNNLYTLSIPSSSATSYSLLVTTKKSDSKCGNLGIDQAGTRTKTGSSSLSDCWR